MTIILIHKQCLFTRTLTPSLQLCPRSCLQWLFLWTHNATILRHSNGMPFPPIHKLKQQPPGIRRGALCLPSPPQFMASCPIFGSMSDGLCDFEQEHQTFSWRLLQMLPATARFPNVTPASCRPPQRRRRIMRASDLMPVTSPAPQPARTVAADPAAALAASMRRTTPAGSRHAHAWDVSDGASTAHRCPQSSLWEKVCLCKHMTNPSVM